MALIDKLNAIGDAIRAKTGGTEKLTLDEMPTQIQAIQAGGEPVITELTVTQNGTYTASDGVDGYSPVTVNVPQDGGPPESAFVISGKCNYRFSYNGWNWFLNEYGDRITTSDITNSSYMFYFSDISKIPFDINYSTSFVYINYMFSDCEYLEELPILNNLDVGAINNLFYDCYRLRNIPVNFASSWSWNSFEELTSAYSGNQTNMFNNCYSLRSIPMNLIKSGNPYATYMYSYFYNGFNHCYVLDELINLPILYTKATWTSNAFYNTFSFCHRLKDVTFALNNGVPYTATWKSQVIDLSSYVGYAGSNVCTQYNSGITADKEVRDDASYQLLKNDPDWFTRKVAYSRYNHDSAVATINSLPDTSAYLATAGGTNTIKFEGQAGASTDGGAINTLTEEEIAVAAAKGWTVTLV